MEKKRQICVIYARIVGWITPLKNWNKGKLSEYSDRKEYKPNVE